MAADKRDAVRAMYAKAKAEGEDDKAATIEAVSALLAPDFDPKKKPGKTADSSVDFGQLSEDAEYEHYLTLMGVDER